VEKEEEEDMTPAQMAYAALTPEQKAAKAAEVAAANAKAAAEDPWNGTGPDYENDRDGMGEPAVLTAEQTAAVERGEPFAEICLGDGCTIELTERRAITVAQLDRIMATIKRRCEAEKWVGKRPGSADVDLTPETMNLYDIDALLVHVATKKRQCAFVELMASGDQPPRWFLSHFWAEALALTIACLRQHAHDRGLAKLKQTATYDSKFYDAEWQKAKRLTKAIADYSAAAYWVCCFANNQWNLAAEVAEEVAHQQLQ
jgi:hypothetical protein